MTGFIRWVAVVLALALLAGTPLAIRYTACGGKLNGFLLKFGASVRREN